MIDDYEMIRSERRSFSCHNRLWEEISKKCENNISISSFIKQAILEKMLREEPKKKDYFEELF